MNERGKMSYDPIPTTKPAIKLDPPPQDEKVKYFIDKIKELQKLNTKNMYVLVGETCIEIYEMKLIGTDWIEITGSYRGYNTATHIIPIKKIDCISYR